MGSDPRAGSAVSTNNASNTLRMPQLKMANILDDVCGPGTLLSDEVVKPLIVSKFGFSSFAETWNGRQAMMGFIIGLGTELLTRQGILSQIGMG